MNLEDVVVYQIYVKSFCDSNGDGIGDIPGITSKLDYLKKLGINYIWLTPIYPSPMNDNGYDVADYYKINPLFGTMKDFETLMQACKERGIEVMLDMVFNHSSTDHEWFQKALTGDKKYMDYYIFKDPVEGKAPTNWISKFGGNAWAYVESLDKYYLHLFDKTQADLNWENPDLREEIYKILNFWLEKGVKGFRFDVVNLISKPAVYENDFEGDGRRFYTDGPKIHTYLKEINSRSFGKAEGIVTVGEMSSTSIENCIKYSNAAEKELSMVFNFHHLKVDYENGEKWSLKPFDFEMLKTLFNTWQTKMSQGGGYNALFWSNHDQPRVVSRLGNDTMYQSESAKMLATSTYLMKGTPYIYQGEELGMTNAYFDSIDEYKDIESINYYGILKEQGVSEDKILEILAAKSRDNARTPMQWDSSLHAGFTTGTPWIAANKNYPLVNAEVAMANENSPFYYFKQLIALREAYPTLKYGSYVVMEPLHKNVFSYKRCDEAHEIIVLCNYFETSCEVSISDLKRYSVILSNYTLIEKAEETILLRPYEAIVLHKSVRK